MSVDNREEKAVSDALIANVLNTRYEDLGEEVIYNSKRRIIDMIGNAIGGTRCDGNPELAAMYKSWGGRKDSTILGYGGKGLVQDVAMLNCIFGRSFDRGQVTVIIDGDGTSGTIYVDGKPIRRFASHITETTALSTLALGEIKGINGKEFITAMVVGDDLAARLLIANDRTPPGQASSPDLPPAPPSRGNSTTFGIAAIYGRVMGLTSEQIWNALGLTMMLERGGMMAGGAPPSTTSRSRQPRPTPESGEKAQEANPGWLGVNDPFFKEQIARGGYDETVSVKFWNAVEARNGINAGQYAEAGWPGVNNPFFGDRNGYYPSLESCNRGERITDGLGKIYHVEQVFKPWPGGRPTNITTEAAIALASNNDINTEEIEEVNLNLSLTCTAVHYSKPYTVGMYPPMNALWNFHFAVANALYRRSSKDEHYIAENILDPKLQALIPKVKLGYLDKPEGVELVVKMKDGRTYSQYVDRPLGEPYKPLTRDGLIDKFMEQVEFSQLVDRKDAEKLVDLLENLEEVDNVNRLTELAVKR
ncbi:MAG TPA: MmgE/PrpD family protein [Dehalococcoidia bacterium]|nr:MmgE/PrpD family protein [Dehalococcoidia bacterium]